MTKKNQNISFKKSFIYVFFFYYYLDFIYLNPLSKVYIERRDDTVRLQNFQVVIQTRVNKV